MKSNEPGVLKKSDLYFSSPSPTAQRLYYYPVSAGHFFCVQGYHLIRENFNSLLIAHIIRGSFTFLDGDRPVTARKGETVILDCFQPHEYYTQDSFESVWAHVNGLNCRALYEEITKNEGNLIRCGGPGSVERLLFRILNCVSSEDRPSEVGLSLDIYKLFAALSNPQHTGGKNTASYEERIQDAKKFIADHLSEALSVREIAAAVHMSASHFSRVFKRQTGFSPYDYVLISRLNRAKDYLQKTDLTIAEIAYEVGFNSESNFIFFFTTNTGLSPSKFRKLRF